MLTGPIILVDSNTLDVLKIEGTKGNAVDADGQKDGTITHCDFANTIKGEGGIANIGTGIRGIDTRGNWIVTANSFSRLGGSAIGLFVENNDTAMLIINENTMTNNSLAALVLGSLDTSTVKASVVGNSFSGNNTSGIGDAFELECLGTSTFCLDLESNTNDGKYSIYAISTWNASLSVEQFSVLTTSKTLGGAGNTGTIDDNSEIGAEAPTKVANGACGF